MSGNLCRCTGYMGLISAITEVMAARTPLRPPGTAVAWLGPPPGPGAGAPHSPTPATAATLATAPPPRAAPALASRAVRVSLTQEQDRDGRSRLSQHFVVEHATPTVWALVADIERLARCMPGLFLDGPPDGERVAGHLDLKLGPITARFAGEGRVQINPAEQRLSVEGRGIDRKGGSNVAGSLACRIEPAAGADGPATAVHLDLTYALTGPLAQIGRGVLARDLARRLGELFAENMARQLTDPAATMPTSPLAGWTLLRQIVRPRVAGWLARLRRRA